MLGSEAEAIWMGEGSAVGSGGFSFRGRGYQGGGMVITARPGRGSGGMEPLGSEWGSSASRFMYSLMDHYGARRQPSPDSYQLVAGGEFFVQVDAPEAAAQRAEAAPAPGTALLAVLGLAPLLLGVRGGRARRAV